MACVLLDYRIMNKTTGSAFDGQNIRMISKYLQLITKHAYIMLTPLNPTLYSKTGVYRDIHYFLISARNIECGYSLEPPRRGGSNEYTHSMF